MKTFKKCILLLSVVLFSIGCSKDDDSAPVVVLSSAKKITSFQFLMTDNPALTNHITTTINETSKDISSTVDSAIDVTALLPDIQVEPKASVSPSGAQNFTNPVVYTVTAEDGTKSTYSVTLTASATSSDAKSINSFTFLASENSALASNVTSAIDEGAKTIEAVVPFGTDITSLSPSIVIAANATVSPLGAQDFSSPVNYTTTAEDGSTASYTATVTVDDPPSSGIFLHEASASNTSGQVTTIDNPLTNGRSDAVLIVTQIYGSTSTYNNHEIGVWYSAGKWTIFNH